MNLQDMKSEILKDSEVLTEYETLKADYEIVKAVLEADKKEADLTQQ